MLPIISLDFRNFNTENRENVKLYPENR
jgi:hypothetical protein